MTHELPELSKIISLLPDQLKQIYGTTLSGILCRNSDNVKKAQKYVMQPVSDLNPEFDCQELDTFDFEPWREKLSE